MTITTDERLEQLTKESAALDTRRKRAQQEVDTSTARVEILAQRVSANEVATSTLAHLAPLAPEQEWLDHLTACTAEDAAGNDASSSFVVTVTNNAPTFTAPANQSVEATSAAGAVATYMAMGDDVEEGPVAAVCAPASGARFPLGTTTVTCTVTDRAGASASASFSVTVVDTTPPTGSCQPGVNPALRTASGRSENGFFVVGGADATGTPALALGPFALAHGEAIKITRSPGARGVVFAGTMGPGGIRHFQVGPGDPILTIVDAAGNQATHACGVLPVGK